MVLMAGEQPRSVPEPGRGQEGQGGRGQEGGACEDVRVMTRSICRRSGHVGICNVHKAILPELVGSLFHLTKSSKAKPRNSMIF